MLIVLWHVFPIPTVLHSDTRMMIYLVDWELKIKLLLLPLTQQTLLQSVYNHQEFLEVHFLANTLYVYSKLAKSQNLLRFFVNQFRSHVQKENLSTALKYAGPTCLLLNVERVS